MPSTMASTKVPATVVLTDKDHGIRFYGLTGGYEFGSLLEAILMVSTSKSGLDPAVEEIARRIAMPTHLEIMVTLTCPYCPRMVRLAHQLAFVNENIRADMVEVAGQQRPFRRGHLFVHFRDPRLGARERGQGHARDLPARRPLRRHGDGRTGCSHAS